MAGKISWIEFRADCHGDSTQVVLIDGETGVTLQEDFDNGCLICPLTGKSVSIKQVLSDYYQAHEKALTLVDTLRFAQDVYSGGGSRI